MERKGIDSINDYLKIKLGDETWFYNVAENYNSNKKEDMPHIIDLPRSVAKKFNIIAKDVSENISKKELGYIINQAKKAVKYRLNRLKGLKKAQNSKKEDNFQIKKDKKRIEFFTKKLELIKKYKSDNSKFKNFVKSNILPNIKNEGKKTINYIKVLEKNKKKPGNEALRSWFDHMIGIENVNKHEIISKKFEELLTNEEKIKKYLNACAKYANENIVLLKGESKKLPKDDSSKFSEETREKIKNLESWLIKIDKVNKEDLKNILEKLKPISLIFLSSEF